MMSNPREVKLGQKQLEEKLNHLEYVVYQTEKAITPFKKGPLKTQTEDFLKLMSVFRDAVATYRDEVEDQADLE